MSIKFLTVEKSSEEYIKTDYFYQMNYIELIYRMDSLNLPRNINDNCSMLRKKLAYYYTSLVTDFNEYEKNIIKFYFERLFDILSKKSPELIPKKKKIHLIKLNEGVDWNYPYTINHSIVLPMVFIKSLIDHYHQYEDQINQTSVKVWNLITPMPDLINQKILVLCHELIHILQRNKDIYPNHTNIFNFIYTEIWGFIKINKSLIEFPHQKKDNFLNVITNPDGYNYEWIIPVYNHETNYDHMFLPLLSRNLNNKPIGIMIELKTLVNNKYLITKHWNDIDKIKRYTNKFYGLKNQLYHPNEISAHLISNYVILNHIYSDTENTIDYYKFYKFINSYLIS